MQSCQFEIPYFVWPQYMFTIHAQREIHQTHIPPLKIMKETVDNFKYSNSIERNY
jgi:hypothetical protein